MELEVYKKDGTKTDKKVELDDTIFGIDPNDHAIYLDVKQYLANQRQGTHSSLEKSMISGSTRKIKKQKGTGGARAGSIKSPLFRGGARAFGPHPRDYNFKLNKKVKQLARASALSYKVKENNIFILEDFGFDNPKTKESVSLLTSFNLLNKKALIVLPELNKNVYLSSRNLQNVKVVNASFINTYDVMRANTLLVLESSIAEIQRINKRD
jgi:large subunit ribosomal protein L4